MSSRRNILLVLALAAALALQFFFAGAAAVIESGVKHDNVILYATSWCGYCKKTRAFLAEHNIQYTEYDVERSAEGQKQFKALGGKGVPVMDIKGTIIKGYSEKGMISTLKSHGLM